MSWQYPPQPQGPPQPVIPHRNATNNVGLNDSSSMEYNYYLESLTIDQLSELVEDEDKINQFVMDNADLKKIKLDKEMLIASSRSIADDNLSKEPKMNNLKENLAIKYEKLKEIYGTYQTNQAKLASLSKGANLETMLAILQTRSAEIEEETEALADQMNRSEIDTIEFLKQYKTKRTLAHLSRIKVDKMKELVMELHRNPPTSNTSNMQKPTPKPRRPAPGPQNAPYPNQYPSQYPPYGGQYPQNVAQYPAQPSGQSYGANSWK